MSPEFLTILPNLSIGVIAVLSLVYVVRAFLAAMDERTKRHEAAMLERETTLRSVEKEMRTSLYEQLHENTKILERVVSHLDGRR